MSEHVTEALLRDREQRAQSALLADEQVAGGGGAGGEGAAVVAARVGERLQGEAVADGEEVGDDRLGVEAEA